MIFEKPPTIATVQSMVRRVMLIGDEPPPPVDQYDCVIIDECHRGYNLDRDMAEHELAFRSEADFIAKYRRVVDHFHAVKIGLTATPALHTSEIFGRPVFTYSSLDLASPRSPLGKVSFVECSLVLLVDL